MDISLLLKTIGVGVIVAVASFLLKKSGRDEQATLVTVAGAVIVILMLIGQISDLIDSVRSVFGL